MDRPASSTGIRSTSIANERIDDPEQAASLLHDTTMACVHTWASCYERILNLLSGGLDSSIVIGCLKTAAPRPEVTNFHAYFAAGSAGDERRYARAAAELTGYPLLEAEMDADANPREIFDIPRTVAPVSSFIELGTLARRRRVCRELNIGALFNGSGGDQLFFQNGSQYACPDYIFERGLRPGLFRVALDAAYMESDVVWALLFRGIRDALARRPLDLLLNSLPVSDMLSPDVRERVARAASVPASVAVVATAYPPGKYWQVLRTLHTLWHEQQLCRSQRPRGCSSASCAASTRALLSHSHVRARERRNRPRARAPRVHGRSAAADPAATHQGRGIPVPESLLRKESRVRTGPVACRDPRQRCGSWIVSASSEC